MGHLRHGRGPIKYVKYVHKARQWCVTWTTASKQNPNQMDNNQRWFMTEAEARDFKNSLP